MSAHQHSLTTYKSFHNCQEFSNINSAYKYKSTILWNIVLESSQLPCIHDIHITYMYNFTTLSNITQVFTNHRRFANYVLTTHTCISLQPNNEIPILYSNFCTTYISQTKVYIWHMAIYPQIFCRVQKYNPQHPYNPKQFMIVLQKLN
jgi:hypothetical protein